MWLLMFACQAPKNTEDRLGESLVNQLSIDEPNILVDKSDERLYLVRFGEILTIEDQEIYWDLPSVRYRLGTSRKRVTRKPLRDCIDIQTTMLRAAIMAPY